MSALYAEGDVVKVRGQRRPYRVTRIRFNGEVDCVDADGKARTFLSDMLTQVGTPIEVRKVGHAAPAPRKAGKR